MQNRVTNTLLLFQIQLNNTLRKYHLFFVHTTRQILILYKQYTIVFKYSLFDYCISNIIHLQDTMTLVTWFAMFCWAVHIGQWTIRWAMRRLTTCQLRYDRDDFADEHTDDLPTSSVRDRSYGLNQTGT